MNKRVFWVLLLIVAVLLVVGFVLPASEQQPTNGDGEPVAEEPAEPITSANGNMRVWAPQPNTKVSRPLVILGEGRTFESAFSFRLLEEGTDEVIAEGHSTLFASDIGQFGPFSVMLDYPQPTSRTPKAVLEVFEYSARDGSVTSNVRIPVLLSSGEETAMQVFFGNSKADPDVLDCTLVFPAYRIVPKTTAVARAALEQLLAGPSENEQELGYFSSIQNGAEVKIQSLTIEDGVAMVDFSAELEENAGGSCRIAAIRSQITNTLTQFPTVDEVIISIDGETEEILQP